MICSRSCSLSFFSKFEQTMGLLYEYLTSKIISAYYTVYNSMGYGFLEGVYENL